MKRYLSLDIGDATIGIAVSDLLGLTALRRSAARSSLPILTGLHSLCRSMSRQDSWRGCRSI